MLQPQYGRVLSWLSADGKKLLAARVLRSFAYGYLTVVLAVYLDHLGLDGLGIGVVLTAAVGGSAVMTIFWSRLADRYGRRRTLATMAALMAAGGCLFAIGGSFWLLLLGAFTGTISATSSEVGILQTIDQAVLPQTAPDARRTWLFSIYNTIATFASAIGALFSAVVGVFAGLGLTGPDVYRPLFVLYALIGLANLAIFATLSDRVELAKVEGPVVDVRRSRGIITRLAVLYGVDAFAGGIVVQSLIAYWFVLRWGLSAEALAGIFFGVGIVSGTSLLAAGWLARRIGLLNTMVFTHLPSNVLLMLVPLAPTSQLAVALFLLRMSISQMDVPTRQSYTMAVVHPSERVAAAGITNVARTTSSALSPVLTGAAFGAGALGLPFFIAGVLKIGYDIAIYRTFRRIRPPEEQERADGTAPS